MKKISQYFDIVKKLIVLISSLSLVMIFAILAGSIGHIIATLIPIVGADYLGRIGDFSNNITSLIGLLIGLAIARSLLRYLEQLCNHFVAFRVLEIIRDKIFQKLRELGPSKMEGLDRGGLLSIITSDIELLEVFYAHTISPVCLALIHTTFFAIYLYKIHFSLAVLLIIFHLLMAILVPIIVVKRSKDYGDENREKTSKLSSSLIDTFYGIEEAHQLFQGDNRRKEILDLTKELNNSSHKLGNIHGENMAISNGIIMLGNISILILSCYLFLNMKIDMRGVLVAIICFMSSFGPVSALSDLANNLLITFACGKRVLNLLDEKPLVENNLQGKEVEFEKLDVDNISYSYGNEQVLNELSLSIKKGEILGISGKSGCGKSTLLKLIMRFYDVDQGSIKKSNVDIRKIRTENLRKSQSYISQSTYLFKGSIMDNLLIAKENASIEEVELACKKASILDFIYELKDGFETKVGDISSSLSTGEKQRLALARGFLQNPSLMLLDEPTANIDSLNESVVLKSIYEEAKDRAVILVSHKKSTLRIADRIKHMERSRES